MNSEKRFYNSLYQEKETYERGSIKKGNGGDVGV